MLDDSICESSRALSALHALDPGCDHDTWMKIAAAAQAAGVSLTDFDAWSQRDPTKYDAVAVRSTWRSLKPGRGIGAATLFYLARCSNWAGQNPQVRSSRAPPAPVRNTRAHDPGKLWEAAEPASANHAYIAGKGGKPDGLRVYRGSLKIANTCVDGWLMLPACDAAGDLQSLQFIAPRRGKVNKLNLPGAPLSGSFHVVGDLRNDTPAYIVEGIGAAWTVHEATGAAAVVTFGSGNTSRVAAAVRSHASHLVLVADRGKESAREADAERLGCTWIELPSDLPDGADVNDLHIRDGIEVVRELLRNEQQVTAAHDAAGARSFAFCRVGDLIGENIKPIAWLVRDYVETDSLALMFGDPGCGKSFTAIDLACCVATGTSWHGRRTTPGPVFYIAGEGQNGLARRFAGWEVHNGVSLKGAPLFVSLRPARLFDMAAAKAVSEAVEELAKTSGQAPALIVIDTLARNFGGADENSAQDMGAFVANLDEYLRTRFRACVMIVHHSGHADKTRARGSTALKGALDAEYSVTKDENGLVRIEATKMKDAEQPEPIAFRMDRVELPIRDDDGQPLHSVALSGVSYVPAAKAGKAGRGRHQTVALQILAELEAERRQRLERSGHDPNGARVKLDEWRARLAGEDIDRKRFYDLRNTLQTAGKIAIEYGDYVRAL
ncbi:AAA family ATPase [Lysobacter niastensis]|uniref:AAA family ATPase n=2 Tax=Lysobacter niastensis TaxID=380629 RepID=A0ABS0B7F9_9GAMM|nr:AAA family ATPase [Lysobacter niastensis]MBF6024848.1 AAA family ATPase [Lysobacter niastensis]